jgi:hypothetical protein
MRLTITLASLLFVFPTAWAQNAKSNGYCSIETIRGAYSGTCTGWITPAPNASMVRQAAIFTVVTDSDGNTTGGGKVSIGGTIVDQAVTGTASISTDCTGSISYDQKINGQPAPKLNIVFNVLGNGDEIRGMSVDPGTVILCKLVRTSK